MVIWWPEGKNILRNVTVYCSNCLVYHLFMPLITFVVDCDIIFWLACVAMWLQDCQNICSNYWDGLHGYYLNRILIFHANTFYNVSLIIFLISTNIPSNFQIIPDGILNPISTFCGNLMVELCGNLNSSQKLNKNVHVQCNLIRDSGMIKKVELYQFHITLVNLSICVTYTSHHTSKMIDLCQLHIISGNWLICVIFTLNE